MSETFNVTSPFDGSLLETLPYHSAADVEAYLNTADKLSKGEPLSVSKRVEILKKTADLLASKREEYALNIAKEGGKPLMDAKVEADRAVQGIHNAIEVINSTHGTEIPMG